jgi:hypothetical protein
MKNFDLLEFERNVSELASELTPRQRQLCSILIAQNQVVTKDLREIFIQALEIEVVPDPKDPVYQALLSLGSGSQLDASDPRAKTAFTVLRSLGAMPDLIRSIKFISALGSLTTNAFT